MKRIVVILLSFCAIALLATAGLQYLDFGSANEKTIEHRILGTWEELPQSRRSESLVLRFTADGGLMSWENTPTSAAPSRTGKWQVPGVGVHSTVECRTAGAATRADRAGRRRGQPSAGVQTET